MTTLTSKRPLWLFFTAALLSIGWFAVPFASQDDNVGFLLITSDRAHPSPLGQQLRRHLSDAT